jgi:serine/threonine-protein kinase
MPPVNVMPAVTATILTYLGRAILIPSTARRTAVLGLITTALLAIAGAVVFKRHLPPAEAGSWRLHARARIADVLGQYQLEEKIGEGGMGVVYRASHAMLRRPTAVKLLPRDRAGEQTIARFEKEVQLTSRLAHPNTIAIYDYGRTPEGVFYYAMEYVEGVDLEDLVRRAGPMPPSRVVHVLAQVCDALDEAHAVGLIHRDIKPANILLCERVRAADVAKVVDFGLVKQVDAGPSPSLSGATSIVGTPLYLSPEAIVSPDTIDARTDIYAVGCVAHYLLTGRTPFEGSTALEVFAKHINTQPERPSRLIEEVAVPGDLDDLVLACLSKNRDDRPASAALLADALRRCAAPRWTEQEARAWWSEHGVTLRSTRSTSPSPSRTLAVDLEHRV